MIIMFEGVDLTGKSNISMELSDRLGVPRFKDDDDWVALYSWQNLAKMTTVLNAYDRMRMFQNFLKQIVEYLPFKTIITDRDYPTEWVYAKTFNRPADFAFLKAYEDYVLRWNPVIIYCYKTKFENFNDKHIAFETVPKILENYEAFLSQTKIPVYRLDTTDENLEREIEEILEYIDSKRREDEQPIIIKNLT